MTLRALIFDVDGTLAETEEVHRQAFNETFAARGLPWHWSVEKYKRLLDVTGGKERLRHFIESDRPPAGDAALPEIAALHVEKTARYTALIDQGAATPRPGVIRLIREARADGLKVAIATTTSLPNVEALLRAMFGAEGMSLFDAIGAGDVVPAKKPAPDIFEWTLRRLALEPAQAVALEDSQNGIRSARGAGLTVVTTPSLYSEGQDFAGSLAVISNFGEPGLPYAHLAGAGESDNLVSVPALRRWLAEASLPGTGNAD